MRPRLVVIGQRGDPPDEVVVGLAAVLEDGHLDVFLGAAVGLADDHVLGDVDQSPRQVARVGGTQRRVGQTLSRAVGGDEVLQHRQALHEVGLDRPLDDFALRVGHQTAHARQLADLLERATRARVGHHEDRVERVEVLDHRLGDLVGGGVPLLDDRLVALLLGDQPMSYWSEISPTSFSYLSRISCFSRRDHDVVLGDRDAGLGGVLEAEVLERVEHQRDRGRAVASARARRSAGSCRASSSTG